MRELRIFYRIRPTWVMFVKATAQTALHLEANDLDGTTTDGCEINPLLLRRKRHRLHRVAAV
jgi:2-iminoacetate synthase ThiH